MSNVASQSIAEGLLKPDLRARISQIRIILELNNSASSAVSVVFWLENDRQRLPPWALCPYRKQFAAHWILLWLIIGYFVHGYKFIFKINEADEN